MEPVIDTRTGMGDLLERVLDKGVIVKLDLIISVAGIPLVGLSLHAALASIETMNAYGMFGDWDRSSRAEAAIEAGSAKLGWEVGENIVLEQFAMVRGEQGIVRSWRPGRAYLTNRRVMLVRQAPFEVLASVDLRDIAGIGSFAHLEAGVTNDVICLARSGGELVLVRARDAELFRACLSELLNREGLHVAELDSAQLRAAFPDHSAESQLWHDSGTEVGWRPGWAAIEDGSFTFWSDFDQCRVVDIRI
ncbi:MAG: gas vesicle protein, partial [Actinomycetes bacterium]